MSNNPYQPPQADVTTSDELPESFLNGKITARQLGTAGWLAIIYLILSIPLFGLSMYSEYVQDDGLKSLAEIFSLGSVVISAYLYLTLKSFLAVRIPGFSINVLTYLLILSGFIIVLVPMVIPEPEPTDWIAMLIYYVSMFIPAGVIMLFYGIKLVRVKYAYPNLKVFGWLTIATAVCFITIILLVIAIPISLVADIFLVLIFFHGRRELLAHSNPIAENNYAKEI